MSLLDPFSRFQLPTSPAPPGWTGGALLLVCAVTACGCAARTDGQNEPGLSADSIAELEAIYEARKDSARMDFNEADVRFMTDMIAHHAQAVVMSRLAPTRGADPAVQTLAARIINSQRDEIATMRTWLRERGQPVPSVPMKAMDPDVHGMEHPEGVPGMLTPEQLRELERARGSEFDRLFLSFMIEHHRGAVVMVEDLFATAGAAQNARTFQLASDIQADQKAEIGRMERLLETLFGEGDR